MRFDCTYTTSLVNWLTQRGCLTSNVITDLPCADLVTYIQGVQLKSGPLTKPGIYHVRRYLLWFCWYDIILLHVQELARLLQERGESVLVICISWISRRWVLVFEQCHFLCFHIAVNSGERVFSLESYLKMMSYVHCRQSFFEKFGRQVPVKSAIAKMIKNEGTLRKVARNIVKHVDKCIEMNGHHFQHLL